LPNTSWQALIDPAITTKKLTEWEGKEEWEKADQATANKLYTAILVPLLLTHCDSHAVPCRLDTKRQRLLRLIAKPTCFPLADLHHNMVFLAKRLCKRIALVPFVQQYLR
jgi:hypothetical protein